jgi:hypothetical protein
LAATRRATRLGRGGTTPREGPHLDRARARRGQCDVRPYSHAVQVQRNAARHGDGRTRLAVVAGPGSCRHHGRCDRRGIQRVQLMARCQGKPKPRAGTPSKHSRSASNPTFTSGFRRPRGLTAHSAPRRMSATCRPLPPGSCGWSSAIAMARPKGTAASFSTRRGRAIPGTRFQPPWLVDLEGVRLGSPDNPYPGNVYDLIESVVVVLRPERHCPVRASSPVVQPRRCHAPCLKP